jgi:tryptophan 2,3-dioxygenase
MMNADAEDRLLTYEFDRGSNYEEDTRLTAALSALIPEVQLVHPDHRLFQTVHLITEYAWCEMHFEVRRAVALLEGREYLFAAEVLERAAAMGRLPVQALALLVTFLPQHSLLLMRDTFPQNTTGLDSPGARNLRRVARPLWRAMKVALAREGLDLERLIAVQGRSVSTADAGREELELSMVRQMLLRLDGVVAEWKQLHLRLIWTQLGGHPETREASADPSCPGLPKSLRGHSISAVERMAEKSLFPELWPSVDDTYRRFVPAGSPPG